MFSQVNTLSVTVLSVLMLGGIAAAAQSPEALAAEKALVAMSHKDSPEKVYATFNQFCKTHFGALDPLVYERFGNDLKFNDAGQWRHVSENSATLAWETNLPAVSYVEYGLTPSYGQKTEATDRAYFLHLHALKGLEVGKAYHYRLVAVDARGKKLVSEDQVLETTAVAGAVRLAASADGSPIKLEKANTTYILTADLTVPGTAIIALRDNITLDLNGYTITFGQDGTDAKDIFGVTAQGTHADSATRYQSTGFRLLNGTIRQGAGKLLSANTEPQTFNAIRVTGKDAEIAGVAIVHHAPQAWAMQLNHSSGSINIHHNVVRDMGTLITNRHGAAVREIGFRLPQDAAQFTIHHNLIQRARQNGIGNAMSMHNNEIYIDSWSTNSFAIQPVSAPGVEAGEHYENRIFGTGFNAYGFGWAHEKLKVRDNLVCMFGLDVKQRWDERWGDINMLAAMRVTNYGKGGQVRNNLEYSGNLILMQGKEGAELQGTRFYSDNSIEGLVFRDNIVKVESLDEKTQKIAPIVAQGHHTKLDSKPIYYRNNRLISNVVLVQFGDSYGKGNNHQFENCTFVRIGDRPDFRTFGFGGAFFNLGHGILDGRFEGGAKPDDVRWDETASLSSYEVRWTLTVTTDAGAAVEIKDRDGKAVASGTAGADGKFVAPLTQCVIRPMEWQPADSPDSLRAAVRKAEHQKIEQTPHTIVARINGREVSKVVTVDAAKQVEVR